MRPTRLFAKKRTQRTRKKQAPGYRKKANAAFRRAREQFFGSQGAASPVRLIDPKTGEVIAPNQINCVCWPMPHFDIVFTSQPCCLLDSHAVNAAAPMTLISIKPVGPII